MIFQKSDFKIFVVVICKTRKPNEEKNYLKSDLIIQTETHSDQILNQFGFEIRFQSDFKPHFVFFAIFLLFRL